MSFNVHTLIDGMVPFLCISVALVNSWLTINYLIRLYRQRHRTSLAEAADLSASIMVHLVNALVLAVAYYRLVQ